MSTDGVSAAALSSELDEFVEQITYPDLVAPWDSSIGPEDELPANFNPHIWVYASSLLPSQVEWDGDVYELVPSDAVRVGGVYMMQRIGGGNLIPVRVTDIRTESDRRRVVSFRWDGDVRRQSWENTYAESPESPLRFLWAPPRPAPTRSRVVSRLEVAEAENAE